MPRSARIVIPDCPHHVTQRGNNRSDVFFVDEDRQIYLDYLLDASKRFDLRIEGYCLMTNHVHLVVTPECDTSLADTMKRTNQLYAQYVNRMHRRSGHLWQDRFFSCTLDEDHFQRAQADGRYAVAQAQAIRSEGERVIAMIEARVSPFGDGWERWAPPEEWSIPELPAGWDCVEL